MSNPFDRLPPQHRLPALIAAAAIGSTVLMLLCGGGIGLLFLAVRPRTEIRPAQASDLPPGLSKEVQTVLSDENWQRANATKSLETPRQSEEMQQLVRDARRLLVAVAEEKSGEMIVYDRPFSIRVGSTYFCKSDEGPRVAALWRLALSVFRQNGWIEHSGVRFSRYTDRQYDGFRLTTAGYAIADKIAKRPGF